jgi:hypothetical protein
MFLVERVAAQLPTLPRALARRGPSKRLSSTKLCRDEARRLPARGCSRLVRGLSAPYLWPGYGPSVPSRVVAASRFVGARSRTRCTDLREVTLCKARQDEALEGRQPLHMLYASPYRAKLVVGDRFASSKLVNPLANRPPALRKSRHFTIDAHPSHLLRLKVRHDLDLLTSNRMPVLVNQTDYRLDGPLRPGA